MKKALLIITLTLLTFADVINAAEAEKRRTSSGAAKAESRVGKTFWLRVMSTVPLGPVAFTGPDGKPVRPTAPTAKFRIVGFNPTDGSQGSYRVRFEDGSEAKMNSYGSLWVGKFYDPTKPPTTKVGVQILEIFPEDPTILLPKIEKQQTELVAIDARRRVGKTYWLRPARSMSSPTFNATTSLDISSVPQGCGVKNLNPPLRNVSRFIVVDVLTAGCVGPVLHVRFDDGSNAWIAAEAFLGTKTFDANFPLTDSGGRATYENRAAELFATDPAAVDARETKKRGVALGMTKEQVIASSWGKPRDVNRTQTEYGLTEQWVYGSGNYLYFRNGVLDSIQN